MKEIEITNSGVFYGILALTIIMNILIIFNINYLYINSLISFVYFLFIPGILSMLMLKIRAKGFWKYLVYSVGLSISFIMFIGLILNWTLPLLQITDKPLTTWPMLIGFDIFLITFWVIAKKNNKNTNSFTFKIPHFDTRNTIFFIIPIIFPLIAIIGALILNNGGSNLISMILLAGIAVYAINIAIFRKSLNGNVYPWALWLIGLSLLLSFSMRSGHIMGWDINWEYNVFQLTKQNAYWSITNFQDAYNACLSITILPSILSIFIKIRDEFIFKLIIPTIFSFTIIANYLVFRKYANDVFSFVAVFFLMSQAKFSNMPELARQEIAFLFFTLMILVLFDTEISPRLKRTIFVIFGGSVIISHYTTGYIMLAILSFIFICGLLYRIWERRKISSKKIRHDMKQTHYLNGMMIIILILFSIFWYWQVTGISDGLIKVTQETIANFGKLFSQEDRAEHTSIVSQLNIFQKGPNLNMLLNNYTTKSISQFKENNPKNTYDPTTYKNYAPRVVYQPPPHITGNQLESKTIIFMSILQVLVKLLILIGVLYLLIQKFVQRRSDYDIEFVTLSLTFLILVGLWTVLPKISLLYPIERVYQQALIFLAISAIIGFTFLLKKIKKTKIVLIIAYTLFITYFLFVSGFIPQLIGSTNPPVTLGNEGVVYNEIYIHNQDIQSIIWLTKHTNLNDVIKADRYGRWRLLAYGQRSISAHDEVFPQLIGKNAYVYAGFTNTIRQIGFIGVNGIDIAYNFPNKFLNDNKNKIYNNGGSEVFK